MKREPLAKHWEWRAEAAICVRYAGGALFEQYFTPGLLKGLLA